MRYRSTSPFHHGPSAQIAAEAPADLYRAAFRGPPGNEDGLLLRLNNDRTARVPAHCRFLALRPHLVAEKICGLRNGANGGRDPDAMEPTGGEALDGLIGEYRIATWPVQETPGRQRDLRSARTGRGPCGKAMMVAVPHPGGKARHISVNPDPGVVARSR
jgi:hypothetical protein